MFPRLAACRAFRLARPNGPASSTSVSKFDPFHPNAQPSVFRDRSRPYTGEQESVFKLVGKLLPNVLHRLTTRPPFTTAPVIVREWAFTVSMVVVGIAANVLFPKTTDLTISEFTGMVLLLVMLFASDWFAVLFTFGSTSALISVSSVASFGLALWFGPTIGFFGAALSMAIVGVHRGSHRRIILENAMSVGLAAFLAAWVFALIGGGQSLPLTSVLTTIAVVVAALVHAAVNFGTVVTGISWDTRQPPFHLARKLSGGYHFLLSVPILGAIIPIVGSVSLLGLLIIPLPLAGAYFAMNALGRLQKETNATLSSLIDALELRDTYTSFHSTRVTLYVQALLDELNDLSSGDRERIALAARLHDIGKVAVRDAVLLKPGPLSPAEWHEMQSHSAVGADLVGQLETYRPCVDVIRHHHERWDGKGYPDKLVSDEIPLGARIIAIADAFDAMTTDRPYRSALSYDDAIGELVKNKAVQFDARLVDAFVHGLSNGQFIEIKAARQTAFSAAD